MSIGYEARPGGGLGFIDYNSTNAAFSVTSDTWTTVENNGLGASTNKTYTLPSAPEVMDSQGRIIFDNLSLGDSLVVRTDISVTPTVNGAAIDYRWQLGTGGGLYTLPSFLGTLANGAGVAVRFLFMSYIYAGDSNTYDNPVELQIHSSEACTVNNSGSAIQILQKGN